jgi:P27 family predicted phage terminase small subunit
MAGTGRPAGRPAKPTEVKRATGNPGGRALPPAPMPSNGLVPSAGVPTPPVLAEDGMQLWSHVWNAGRSWLSPESDYTLVRMLCEAHDEHEAIRSRLASGEVERYYVTANGQIVTHPLVTQLSNLRSQMTAWLAAIGFSPADRSRLGLAEVRVRDELDELEKRRASRSA